MEKLEGGQVTRTLFDDAEDHALNLLRYSVLPLWKGTQEFRGILRDLKVSTISELGGGGGKGLAGNSRTSLSYKIEVGIELEVS